MLICGIKDERARVKLLGKSELTLESAVITAAVAKEGSTEVKKETVTVKEEVDIDSMSQLRGRGQQFRGRGQVAANQYRGHYPNRGRG